MRIVIEVRRDVNPNVVLNNLYKHTAMQSNFGINMLALVNGEPKVLELKRNALLLSRASESSYSPQNRI